MRTSLIACGITVAICMMPSLPHAQQYVYPAKGQTAQQQKTDEAACSDWAVKSSGYDPAHPPVVAKAQPAPVTGSGASGGNDLGNAAAKGAVVGGVVRRNRNRAAAAQQNQAAASQQQAAQASYAKARQACLEGRGYSVK